MNRHLRYRRIECAARSLPPPFSLVALIVVCLRLRDAATGHGTAPRAVCRRILEPDPGDSAPRHSRRRLRRRAGRPRPRRQGGEGSVAAVPRRALADRGRWRAGPARARVRSELRHQPPVRDRLHRQERRHESRPLPLERHEGAPGQRHAACSSSTSRTRTTTAARSPTARTGSLYVGMGDGGSGGDPENRAQNPNSLLGKILRLDPARPGTKPVIVADGVRNPWRFSFDRANGDLWIGDVGQGSIEEVDHVAWPWKGLLNFGWDVYEGRASFEQKALGPGKLVMPVAQYSHSRGLLDHGRPRLPRLRRSGCQGPVLLRRLLQRDDLVAQARQRCRPSDQAGALHRQDADLVRRGRRRRALRRRRRGPGLQARVLSVRDRRARAGGSRRARRS